MNILILSVGTRNKIVQYFKKELKGRGKVFAADNSPLAPALYEADEHIIVPLITDKSYIDIILNICIQKSINCVLTLIDPELSLLAKNAEKFKKIGVVPIISDFELVELCFDKFKFLKKLSDLNFDVISTYENISSFETDFKNDSISFPVFVKPFNGSASLNTNIITNMDDLRNIFSKQKGLIIQRYIKGKEYGADAYFDLMTGELKSLFVKEKLLMKSGETYKSVSTNNNDIKQVLLKLFSNFNFRGVIDIDILEMDGLYYVSEVNPRFGGGYPHAFECGINIPKQIIANLFGSEVECYTTYKDGVYMLKYNDIIIKKDLKG